MINTQIQKARSMFPNMPDDIFDQWIASSIPLMGWTFTSVYDSISGTKWESFFLHKPLTFWSIVKWKLAKIPVNYSRFNIESSNRIKWVLSYCAFDNMTPTANLHNTKERFWACTRYIKENKKLPKPIVGISKSNEIIIVDGHHRLAALHYLQIDSGEIPIYIGFIKHVP